MYVNNIAENRSTRVLQRPGGQQSFNIFGGDDHAAAPAAARGGAPAAAASAAAPAAAPVEQLKPTYSMHSSSDIFGTKPVSAAAPSSAAAPRVNNIWGSNEPAPSASSSASASASASYSSPPAAAAAAAPVNNIWGTNDSGNKPSTRVLNRPGGGSAGVAGILGGADADAPVNKRANAARINAVSADSPFATSAQSQQPQRRQGGGATRGSGNILSWE